MRRKTKGGITKGVWSSPGAFFLGASHKLFTRIAPEDLVTSAGDEHGPLIG